MGGRKWSLYFSTVPEFEEEAKSNLPAFVLASGVALSFLLFGITWMLVRSRAQAVRASADLGKPTWSWRRQTRSCRSRGKA